MEEQDGWVLQQSPGEKAGKQLQDLRGVCWRWEQVSVCAVSQLHMATHGDRTATSVHPDPGGRMLQPLCPWRSVHSHVRLALVPVVVQPLRVSPERCRSLPSSSLSPRVPCLPVHPGLRQVLFCFVFQGFKETWKAFLQNFSNWGLEFDFYSFLENFWKPL